MIRAALTIAFFGWTLFAQQIFTNSTVTFGPNGDIRATFSALTGNPGAVVTGAPFSADRVSEHVQTLADGTHIRPESTTEHIARDSQGRTRIERPLINTSPGTPTMTVIQIFDPVAGAGYILDEQNNVAHRVPMKPVDVTPVAPAPGGGNGSGSGGGRGIVSGGTSIAVGSNGIVATGGVVQPRPNRPTSTHETLGEQTIEGVVADGTRSSNTWPVGSQGNDRPITDTNEAWYSRELKETVLSRRNSPQFGEYGMKLINISRAEPDAALFLPPPDYTIVEDKDTITLNLKRP
jgi:hypothetical protein